MRPSAVAADIATLGTGTLLAGLFNVALVFVVPKLASVEDYGYWRTFGLYAGYVGFLHFGFADGALLRWAGRPIAEFHHEIWPAMKYLFWQHVAVLAPLGALVALIPEGRLRFVGFGVIICALIFNEMTLLQFGLQSARAFRPVAISVVAAPAAFLGFLLLCHLKWHSDYRQLVECYLGGYVVVLAFLLGWTKPWKASPVGLPIIAFAKKCVTTGWPIVIANTGVILIVFADRLAVSWAASIQDFAQYSLAANAMSVPITVIQACSKVFFSHLAGAHPERRRQVYGVSSRMLLIAWVILLPYYFVLDAFIRHVLPKYVASLAYARILLLGIPFFAVIQILQMSYTYLNGRQKQFLTQTVAILCLSLSFTAVAAFRAGSLQIVAGVQVAILGGWWFLNEWSLRRLTGERRRDWGKFLAVYGLACAGYCMITAWSGHGRPGLWLLGYYVAMGAVLTPVCRRDIRLLNEIRGW